LDVKGALGERARKGSIHAPRRRVEPHPPKELRPGQRAHSWSRPGYLWQPPFLAGVWRVQALDPL